MKWSKGLLGVSPALVLAAAAYATPQESVTFTNVDSNGAVNTAVNTVLTNSFTGGYAVKAIRITSTQHVVTSGTYRSEARILVTPPSGAAFELQPSLHGSGSFPAAPATVSNNDLVLPVPTPIANAAGTWTFRFFESFDDGGTSAVDSNWDSIQITLDDAAPSGLVTLAGPGTYTESEPNDNQFANYDGADYVNGATSLLGGANLIPAMVSGESLTGTTTGSSTTAAGAASADNFLVRAATDVPAIYRYQMTLSTAGTAGHTCTLRGFTQNTDAGAGVPSVVLSGSDATFQTHVLSGTNRVNEWYGFGKGAEVVYRVTGGSTTTSPYTATLTRTTVSPTVISGTLGAGPVTISRGSGNTNTVDIMLFDSNYNAIVGGNTHSSVTSLTRTLPAGTYYMAVSNVATANSLASAADSTNRTNNVATTPDFVMNSSSTTLANLDMTVSTGSGAGSSLGVSKANAFDVAWFQFTLVDLPTNPSGTGSASVSPVLAGNSTLLRVTVTPGANPTSTAHTVTANLTSIGGSASQAFYDDGTNGDATPGDNVYSYLFTVASGTPSGTDAIPFTVQETAPLSRSSSGSFNLNVQAVVDLGSLAIPQQIDTGTFAIPAAGVVWYRFTVPTISNSALNWLDTWTTGGGDTEIAMYDSAGNFIATDDDGGVGLLSQMSFGLVSPTRPDGGSDTPGNGRNGSLAAGTYYLGVGQYNTTWNATNWSTSSTGAGTTTAELIIDLGQQSDPAITGHPASGTVGGNVLLTATVIAGQNPPSQTLAVTGDLTAIGGGSTQAFYDDGTNGDVTAGDLVYSYLYTVPHDPAQAAGSFSVPVTVTDDLNRTGSGSIAVTLGAEPTGACCTGGNCSITTAYACGNGGGTYNGNGSDCSGFNANNASPGPFPVPIQDLTTSTTSFTISGTGATINNNLNVAIGLHHTFVGDVHLTLDNGTTSVVLANGDGIGDDLAGVYGFSDGAATTWITAAGGATTPIPAGNYIPDNPLSAFNGASLDGTWTLTVYDDASLDTGTIDSFALGLALAQVCAPTTGSCCTNNTCTITAQADCTGVWTAGGTCTGPSSCAAQCGSADFNCDGNIGTDQDIEAFFACLAGSCPSLPCISSADFNGDGNVGTDSDIASFFSVLGGGPCT